MTLFERYIGIDYSGAVVATASLQGLRVYMATPGAGPEEVPPPPTAKKYWTRRGIAEWLAQQLGSETRSLVGIDHGFSFPLAYFHRHKLPHDWPAFLDDFQEHWPTDEDHLYVDFIRDGLRGNGAARTGNSKWRRLAEVRTGAKSVFHFDVQGQVAKSTHAGIPWLRYLRNHLGEKVHFWPFDAWEPLPGRSVIAEVYPRLWKGLFPISGLTGDQQDAFSVAAWMQREDRAGGLATHFKPALSDHDRAVAEIEGWILGLAGGEPERGRQRKKSEADKSDGSREVAEIVTLWRAVGQSVNALHSLLRPMPLSQIHSALAYYYDHRNAIDKEIAERR